MTIVAFLDLERADKWLKGMEELGYVVTETKVSPSGGTVHMLDKLSGVPNPPGNRSELAPTHLQALFGTSNAGGDDATPRSVVTASTSHYADATTPELHAELVRLGAALQSRGVIV